MQCPDRGDFIFLDFDPQAGTEQAGHRLAIVLSPKRFNEVTGYATVCPVSRTDRKWGFHIQIPDDAVVGGVVIADQMKNLDWRTRNARIAGQAPNNLVNRVVKVIHTYI
ncbi:type II toxin-antitoxin system PemK/MazF family toxin [Lentibacillus sp. CBA3610]|uniref:type II toxin-antitoxin system PemK/MazF family toxin n=1 Tax=Lentibacillus sp. CBA3610 TaxID=2518176 RepID=UPI001595452D|nr:type II toxin-antitoxin system PemK/MazF family toxin [Lentibacillus sp. CBA3610]QKY71164.1 mRNA-degrading endonuclease [Lentibacillus sp. CBA3610]